MGLAAAALLLASTVSADEVPAASQPIVVPAPASPPPVDNSTFRVFWKNGLRMETPDKATQIKIGGRIMLDWMEVGSNAPLETATGNFDDGVEFRRARLYIAGQIRKHVIFKAQYDFAGGDADFKDVYLGLHDIPHVGTIRVGHFFEPFSLEQNTSSKYITFMERALPNALAFERNTGLMVNNTAFDKRMFWAVGTFYETDDFGDSTGDNLNFTGRLAGLPLYDDEEDRLIHLGTAYRYSNPDDGLRISARPEAHQAPGFVDTDPDPLDPDTNDFAADDAHSLGTELAMVCGPFSLQGEYIRWWVDGGAGIGDPTVWGAYAYVSYFLTGEHRRYDRNKAVFTRVKPKNDFLEDGGVGAWEIGARFSRLDTNDEGIKGGQLNDITAGVNWYLNPNTRVMINYTYADLSDRDPGEDGAPFDQSESTHIGQMRFQIDF